MTEIKPSAQPTLTTDRLILRPFCAEDAADAQRLAGKREIAATLTVIPHPYEDGMAEAWIATHKDKFREGKEAHFAIILKDSRDLIGAIGLSILRENVAELGYWVGLPYWKQGYCTEAGRAVLRYIFNTLGLPRVYASHFDSNPASGRVLQKLGMRHEGCQRQHAERWGQYFDLHLYGILRGEFEE